MKGLDLTNKRFGHLTYIKPVGKKCGEIVWLCKCDCGQSHKVKTGQRHVTKRCSKTCPLISKAAHARKHGVWICDKHGEVKCSRQAPRCVECQCEADSTRYTKFKQKVVNYLGGKCVKCGYDRCIAALDCHHVDPDKKDFQITGKIRAWADVVKELKKCILLCAICHRELHAGFWDINDAE